MFNGDTDSDRVSQEINKISDELHDKVTRLAVLEGDTSEMSAAFNLKPISKQDASLLHPAGRAASACAAESEQ